MNDNPRMRIIYWLKSLRGTRAGKLIGAKRVYYKLLRSHLRRRPFEFGDFGLFLNPMDNVIMEAMIAGNYEPAERALLAKLTRPGDVVLDLGANIGFYTVLCARLAGAEGRVFAFEPDPLNFSFLKKNILHNKLDNATAFDLAVSSAAGEHTFHINPFNPGDHRLFGDDHHSSSITVRTVALDEFLADRAPKIDLIKMDIQGAEIEALLGMKNLLADSPDARIMVEFWPYALKLSGHDPAEFPALLRDAGLHFFIIDENDASLTPADIDSVLAAAKYSKTGDLKYEDDLNLICAKNPDDISSLI